MRTLLGMFMLLTVIGCGSPTIEGPKLVKTQGQLMSGSKPAAGAILIFHRSGDTTNQTPPRAQVGADGRYQVTSADGREGLPEGDYVVTVVWRAGTTENDEDGKSLVAGKYSQPTSTPLKATVKPGADGACTLQTFTLAP